MGMTGPFGRAVVAICAGGALVLAACSGDQQGADDTPSTAVVPAPTSTAVPQQPTAEPPRDPEPRLPQTPAGEQLAWVLQQLHPDADPVTEAEVLERFHEGFLSAVPVEQIEPVLAQMRQEGPYTVNEVYSPDGSGQERLVASIEGTQSWELSLSVDADGLIIGLLIEDPAALDLPEVESWAELEEHLGGLVDDSDPAIAEVFVASAGDAGCAVDHQSAGDAEPAPSGSMFKLVVLAVLTDQIEAGALTWDDELVITDEVKSLPSGRLQDEPDGSTVTVQEAADLMISISDNTATDLLMDAIGVETIEAALPELGITGDELLPLLTTRQFFQINWGAVEVRRVWPEAGLQERRDLLTDLPDTLDTVNLGALAFDGWGPGKADWYLSGPELCAVWSHLMAQAATDAGAPVAEIVSQNPGLRPPEGAGFIGFKGGSSPGNLALSWYVETDGDQPGQGKVLVVRVSQRGGLDENAVAAAGQAALNLLVSTESQ